MTAKTQRQVKPSRLGWLALVPLTLFLLALDALVRRTLPWVIRLQWIPSLGVEFSIFVDGLALQFVLLITGIGTFVLTYASAYMAGERYHHRLFVLLLAFMIAMLGCVTADNLLVLFMFWELTSITSFLLIGYKHEKASSRASAQQALMVTGAGGLALLVGFILIGEIAGTYSVRELVRIAASSTTIPCSISPCHASLSVLSASPLSFRSISGCPTQ